MQTVKGSHGCLRRFVMRVYGRFGVLRQSRLNELRNSLSRCNLTWDERHNKRHPNQKSPETTPIVVRPFNVSKTAVMKK
jgi:hypothetical protein